MSLKLEHYKKHLFSTTGALLLLALTGQLQAEIAERERLMAVINQTIQDSSANQQALNAGKDRSLLCASCHGIDGNSDKPDMPNLAAQNPAYIVEQIAMFADGRRRNFVMQALTRDFTFEDKVNLAIYFTSQEVKPVAYDERLASRGADIYMRSCFRCHGENGKGEEGYARIAGQQIAYVEMTLKRYRANANRSSDPEDRRRSNASMEQVTGLLSDGEISSLAHYLAKLR